MGMTTKEEISNTKRYEMADGRQLLDHIEEMFSPDEVRGFYKINNLKYMTRYKKKHGIQDLEKAMMYMTRLKLFEGKLQGCHDET